MSYDMYSIDVVCPKCKKGSKHMPIDAFWGCEFCDYLGHRTTFLDWSGSKVKKPEPPTKAEPSSRSYSSVVAWLTQTEPPAKVNEFVVPGGLTGPINVKPGSVTSCSTSTPKGETMKIKSFIVRSFLRSFRHSLFILAIWKAAELVHWAWPGMKMVGRMLYPPIYAVAHAVDVFVHGPDATTSGGDVVAIWLGIIIVAFVAVALLRLAWLQLNRLARAAFIEAVK